VQLQREIMQRKYSRNINITKHFIRNGKDFLPCWWS